MKAFKKVAAFLVVAILLLQIPVFSQAPLNDVIGTPCEKAVRLVSALGIMQGDGAGNFSPDDNITREEFAQILMKVLKLEDAVSGYVPTGIFSDVPTTDIFATPIELGASIGIINGMGDGTFDPKGNVTGEQAIKMLIHAIGYEVEAMASGGYPAGYVMAASSSGLLKTIDKVSLGEPITRSTAVIMLYNALHVDVLKKVSFGGRITYVSTPGVNLMTDKHNVFRVDGKVIANSSTTLWASSTIREGSIQIEKADGARSIYQVGDTDVEDQLGKYLRLYYLLDDEEQIEPLIISYEVMDNKNTILEIDINNIEASETIIEDDGRMEVAYWIDKDTDRRTTSAFVKAAPEVIYNGAASTGGDFLDIIEGKEGSVTLINNDNDSVFDIISITAYENFVISAINTDDYIIYDKVEDGKSITLNIDDEDADIYIVDKDGAEVAFDDLSELDVISIAASMEDVDRQVVRAVVSDEIVSGTITEIGEEDGREVITVNDTNYKLASNIDDLGRIDVGNEIDLYLDAFGKIAYTKGSSNSGSTKLGVAVKTINVTSGVATGVKIKMFTEDWEFEWLDLAGRVVIDGVTYEKNDDKYNNIMSENTKCDIMNDEMRLLMYTLNSDGKIKTIDTPKVNAIEDVNNSLQEDEHSFDGDVTYLAAGRAFAMSRTLSEDARVVVVPGNEEYFDDVNAYDINTHGILEDRGDYNGSEIAFFKLDEESIYSDILLRVRGGAAATGGQSFSAKAKTFDLPMMIVKNVTEVYDTETQETVGKIYGFVDGAEVQVVCDEKIKFNNGEYISLKDRIRTSDVNYQKGTVIRYFTNSEGRVDSINEIYWYRPDLWAEGQAGTFMHPVGAVSWLNKEHSSQFPAGHVKTRDGNILEIVSIKNTTESGSTGAGDKTAVDFEYDPSFLTPADGQNYVITIGIPSDVPIMVYDPSKPEDQQIYKGTINDIRDSKRYPTDYSRIMMRLRSSRLREVIVFNDCSLLPK